MPTELERAHIHTRTQERGYAPQRFIVELRVLLAVAAIGGSVDRCETMAGDTVSTESAPNRSTDAAGNRARGGVARADLCRREAGWGWGTGAATESH